MKGIGHYVIQQATPSVPEGAAEIKCLKTCFLAALCLNDQKVLVVCWVVFVFRVKGRQVPNHLSGSWLHSHFPAP
jgi:hypothetical protein